MNFAGTNVSTTGGVRPLVEANVNGGVSFCKATKMGWHAPPDHQIASSTLRNQIKVIRQSQGPGWEGTSPGMD
jgi:hypothetical protein